jgi:uncharacterized protein
VLWWLLLGLAAVWLFKNWRRRIDRPEAADEPGTPAPNRPASPRIPLEMVRCAHCGMHLPSSEAIRIDGMNYCSPAHRDAGPRTSARGDES